MHKNKIVTQTYYKNIMMVVGAHKKLNVIFVLYCTLIVETLLREKCRKPNDTIQTSQKTFHYTQCIGHYNLNRRTNLLYYGKHEN